MKKVLLKCISFILILLIILILFVDIVLIIQTMKKGNEIPSIFGYKFFIQNVNTMKPNINVGDLVIIKNVDIASLREDDVIAYRTLEDKVIMHRIISMDCFADGDLYFETKGDSNLIQDEGVIRANMVEGKMLTNIPKLGSAILFMQTPLGIVITLVIICLVITIVYQIEDKEIENRSSRRRGKHSM